MSSLSSTAEEILALFDKGRVHPDRMVDRAILKTDIEGVLHQYAKFVIHSGRMGNDLQLRNMILTNKS